MTKKEFTSKNIMKAMVNLEKWKCYNSQMKLKVQSICGIEKVVELVENVMTN